MYILKKNHHFKTSAHTIGAFFQFFSKKKYSEHTCSLF